MKEEIHPEILKFAGETFDTNMEAVNYGLGELIQLEKLLSRPFVGEKFEENVQKDRTCCGRFFIKCFSECLNMYIKYKRSYKLEQVRYCIDNVSHYKRTGDIKYITNCNETFNTFN